MLTPRNLSLISEKLLSTFSTYGMSHTILQNCLMLMPHPSCNMNVCYSTFPDYFATKTSRELTDLGKTPYSCAYGSEGMTFYEVMTAVPERFSMFNKAMMKMESNLPILGMFDFSSLKQEYEAEPDRAFIVDIGGGRGQCLLEIQKETVAFDPPPRMILEDRPPVLDSIPQELLPGIEKVPYDYYTEQPVKSTLMFPFRRFPLIQYRKIPIPFNIPRLFHSQQIQVTDASTDAHIYYLRRITHNYYDGPCISILRNIGAAMGPSSRLLIAEFVVPEKTEVGEDMSTYWMDMVMLAIGGKERSAKEFGKLIEEVGLELVKIWPASVGRQGIVECRKKS